VRCSLIGVGGVIPDAHRSLLSRSRRSGAQAILRGEERRSRSDRSLRGGTGLTPYHRQPGDVLLLAPAYWPAAGTYGELQWQLGEMAHGVGGGLPRHNRIGVGAESGSCRSALTNRGSRRATVTTTWQSSHSHHCAIATKRTIGRWRRRRRSKRCGRRRARPADSDIRRRLCSPTHRGVCTAPGAYGQHASRDIAAERRSSAGLHGHLPHGDLVGSLPRAFQGGASHPTQRSLPQNLPTRSSIGRVKSLTPRTEELT
jgi:hypothetical protein